MSAPRPPSFAIAWRDGGFIADASGLPKCATVEQAIARGLESGRPFDVVAESGAIMWVWEMRPDAKAIFPAR